MATTATASTPGTITRRHTQAMSFNRMVTAAITLIVGVLVFNQIVDALPRPEDPANSSLVNLTSIEGTIESAFTIAPVVLIVLVAGLILAQVTGFGR